MRIQREMARRVALAVRTLAKTGSDRLGGDCIWHAMACWHLLALEGISEARVAGGYACWRVDGEDPGAVVCHHPRGHVCMAKTTAALFVGHAWVVCGDQIFDTTTYQLRQKVHTMDEADGLRTRVSWCPDYLLAVRQECRRFETVRNGYDTGMLHYEEIPEIASQIQEHRDMRMDSDDAIVLEAIYGRVKNGESLVVFGPRGTATT